MVCCLLRPTDALGERRSAVQFRWIALIALWSCLAGPIFGGAPRPAEPQAAAPAANADHPNVDR
jgi:hypothetical protein